MEKISVAQWGFKEDVIMKKIICYFVIMCFSLACPGMAVLPAAIAAELSGGEEQTVVYSKEVLQKTLNDIKNNLAEGVPSTTELILLENIKNELTEQIIEADNTAEEVRMALSGSDLTDFEIRFEEKMNGLNNLIEGINGIIISASISIEQVDNVLNLIETLEPEIQHEILATKPELPNRIVDTKVNVFKERPAKATGAPVTEADLAATEEIIITPEIEALALELNNDVVDIFTWVKFNIDYEPYYGSMKGSNETLIDMAGNDCDQSSLLLALLRASGIPSRYVRGDVELKIEDLMNWTGGKTPEAAIAIMEKNKIPTFVIYKFDEPEGVIFDHIWVEAFDGHNWRLMDPSFKTYVYTEGVGLDIDDGDMATLADAVVETGNTILIDAIAIEAVLKTQASKLADVAGHLTVDEALGKKEILVSEKNNLPPYLARGIIGDRKPAEEFSVMPEDMRVKVRVIMPGGSEYITSLSTIAGKRVSVVYVPATDYDQFVLDYYGGIYNVPFPSLLVQMKPVLQIDGETVATGTIIGLGLSNQSVRVGFLRPGIYDPLNPVWEETNKPLLSGNRYNISITTQKTSLYELKRLSEELENEMTELLEGDPALENTLASDNAIDNSLYVSGMLYFSTVDMYSDYASRSMNIVSVSHISVGFLCNEIKPVGFFGMILSIARGGAHIDVVRSVKCPTSTIGNRDDEINWMKAIGAIGTNMESDMLETLYEIDSVSTGKVFAEAAKQGVPIHILDNPETLEADLAAISAYAVTKNHIRTYVNAGYTAMIPQRSITVGSWSGQGWIVMEEATGSAGYMICGGLHGDNTMVNGGSLSQAVDNLYITLLKIFKKAHAYSDAKVIEYTAAIGAAFHLVAAMLLILKGCYIFAFWYLAITLVIICMALFIIRMLDNYTACIRIRKRRGYAFA